jgi:enoyl-CoA hydratase/carnithine racemase
LCADRRVAGEKARLGQPEILLGVIPGAGGTQRLARLVGPSRAKDLCFTGRFVGAEEALRIGLVDRVVPADELTRTVFDLARTIAANAPLSIRNTKRIIRHLTRRPLGPEELAEIAVLLRQTQGSADFQEGQRAVLEKRLPRFEGR